MKTKLKGLFLRDKEEKFLSKKFQIDIVNIGLGKNMCYTSKDERLSR